MNDKPSRMDYRQHQAARRLVHECCNYDEGNCLLFRNRGNFRFWDGFPTLWIYGRRLKCAIMGLVHRWIIPIE